MSDNTIFQAIENYINNTKNSKCEKNFFEIILLSVLAGVFISLGAFVSVNVGVGLPIGAAKFLGGLTFSAGLIMIVLLGAELFTGNILTTFHFVQNKTLKGLFKLWIIVYIGNLLGCLLSAYLLSHSGLSETLQDKFNNIAAMKVSLDFCQAFVRGVFCNLLVCVAVLIANQAKTVQGKILGILVPITIFIISGYEHSVANMFFLPMGNASLSGFVHNLLPVTFGNVIGALFLVFILYYSYVNQSKPRAVNFDKTYIAKNELQKTENQTVEI